MTGSPESGDGTRSYLGELKRRHVFRVLIVYVAMVLGVLLVAVSPSGRCTFPPGR